MRALGCLPPTLEPRATDFIPQMISTIEKIIANGHAYAVEGGDVFFEVATLPGYGQLSGRQQEDNRCGVHGGWEVWARAGRRCRGRRGGQLAEQTSVSYRLQRDRGAGNARAPGGAPPDSQYNSS